MRTLQTVLALLFLFPFFLFAEETLSTNITHFGSSYSMPMPKIMPRSKLPGPPRQRGALKFELTETNSLVMKGFNDPANERWCDLAGNIYSSEYMKRFDYEKTARSGPIVRIRIDKAAPTFRGRLEARGLKPNFAYQMKLRGKFEDRKSFEAIGYAGRWRLPGKRTNYDDIEYQEYENKAEVEAYLFFDYFITDAAGDAIRDFALDSSLHVIWSALHQYLPDDFMDIYTVLVIASDPKVYARPKKDPTIERVWAERELSRYKEADQKQFLQAGTYNAELVLTEESFHSWYRDGGYWATVYSVPVSFTVLPDKQTAVKERK